MLPSSAGAHASRALAHAVSQVVPPQRVDVELIDSFEQEALTIRRGLYGREHATDSEADLQRTAYAIDGLGVEADGVEARDLRRWRFAT